MEYLSDVLSGFKKLLKIEEDLIEDDQVNLQNDIRSYIEIINSDKYADSNSDTKPIIRLVKAMQVEQNPMETDNKDMINNQSAKNNGVDEMLGQFIQPEIAAFGKKGFLERTRAHLDLLRQLEDESTCFLPGQPVYQGGKFGGNFRLPNYKVPMEVYGAIEAGNEKILNLQVPIEMDTYVKKFQTLLWVEEAHQAIEMHRYDLYDQMIGKYSRDLFLLVVPGLAEGRPSLIRGDRLILKCPRRSTNYEGYIHDVREKDVLFKLHQSIYHEQLDGLRFDISFLASRTAFRRCHYGIENFRRSPVVRQIVFPLPKQQDVNDQQLIRVRDDTESEFRCFMTCLNVHQRKAVINVLKGHSRPAPYIIFGPPGTGKTVTMVEAILQVYARNPRSKLLICGNSNSCTDLLAERIKFSGIVPKDQMARLSAFYRMEKLIPEEIEDITVDLDMLDSIFSKLRIIVTTCIQSGTLYEFNEKFDYVFIDEAGHANEPEALISIGLVNEYTGSVVLAGDFQQLGPVVVSHVSKYNGLGTSLLERLSRRSVYQRRSVNFKMIYDERYLTKLMISYRSDPRVLEVSNKLFYNSELKFVISTPKRWLETLNVKHPLVFHPVKGKDRREYLNPSWFNPNEAIKVIVYVSRLYNSGLKPEQLGIITPYRRQIDKLYLLFERLNLPYCKIATMEEFQGDEREVIIISTVRTREKNLGFDKKFNLGFLFDEKRFNVAISRAKWLCIVVGDPQILKQDPCWVKFMELAHKIQDDGPIEEE